MSAWSVDGEVAARFCADECDVRGRAGRPMRRKHLEALLAERDNRRVIRPV